MRRLHRGDDTQFGEARQIGRQQHLDVLDAVAAVACTIGPSGSLVAVQRPVDCRVADRMHRNLQAVLVGLDADGVELVLPEEGIASLRPAARNNPRTYAQWSTR